MPVEYIVKVTDYAQRQLEEIADYIAYNLSAPIAAVDLNYTMSICSFSTSFQTFFIPPICF